MPYPVPVFFFEVVATKFKDQTMGFSEVTGLNQEIQVMEYRHGKMKEPAPMKKPGLKKYPNIVLKRGIVKSNLELYEWFSNYNWEENDRIDLQIILKNEGNNPVMVWNVKRAFPVKIDGPQLKASGNEVAIESMELACEKIEISLAP